MEEKENSETYSVWSLVLLAWKSLNSGTILVGKNL